jgi:hypothetical protein
MKSARPRGITFGLLAIVGLTATACQSIAPPTASAAHVTLPVASLHAAPTDAQDPRFWTLIRPDDIAVPGSGSSASTCLECDSSVDTTMSGVSSGPAGLVAVGWVFQGLHGAVWHSADGTRWALDEPFGENTILTAVAADDHRYVAVGQAGSGATAWTSSDGVAWQQVSGGSFSGDSLHMTAVVRWTGGFAAGGYSGTETGSASAAFWVSTDGLMWRRAPESARFGDAHVWSIAAGGPGLIAVGVSGTGNSPGPAAVWTSSNGIDWTRLPPDPVFDGAGMRAVTAIRGIGLVAAGTDTAGDTGVAWTSVDGTRWTRSPGGPDLGGPDQKVRINALSAGGPGVVAVGFASRGADAQYGDGAVWTSPDGKTWQRQPSGVEFVASKLTAVTPLGRGLVAVGDTGAPDDFGATVWLSPAGLNH